MDVLPDYNPWQFNTKTLILILIDFKIYKRCSGLKEFTITAFVYINVINYPKFQTFSVKFQKHLKLCVCQWYPSPRAVLYKLLELQLYNGGYRDPCLILSFCLSQEKLSLPINFQRLEMRSLTFKKPVLIFPHSGCHISWTNDRSYVLD